MAIPSPGIYGIDGQFGSGKTLFAVRAMNRLHKLPNTVILTNISLNFKSSNILFFNDYVKKADQKESGLLHIMRYIYETYTFQRNNNTPRNKRINFYLFLDETGILFNKNDWKNVEAELIDYLLQIRKLNCRLYLIAQKYTLTAKQLREHIDYNYYTKMPFGLTKDSPNIFGLKNIAIVRKKIYDEETGQVAMVSTPKKGSDGSRTMISKPQDWYYTRYFRKPLYKLYDDLYMNRQFEIVPYSITLGELKTYVDTSLKKNIPKEKKSFFNFQKNNKGNQSTMEKLLASMKENEKLSTND